MAQEKKVPQIRDAYKYVYYTTEPLITTLLPTNDSFEIPASWLFYNEYLNNTDTLDRRFYNMFKSYSFLPMDLFILEDSSYTNKDIAYVYLNEFHHDVLAYLTTQAKRYNELYRMYDVADADYMLLDNYNVTETQQKTTSNSTTDTYGARSDSTNTTLGQRSDTSSETNTKGVAGYNSDSYSNDTQITDSVTNTLGQQQNTDTFSKGSQSDTHADSGTENYTLTRKGNIGVATGSDMLRKHEGLWKSYEFYDMIFKDISREFLLN